MGLKLLISAVFDVVIPTELNSPAESCQPVQQIGRKESVRDERRGESLSRRRNRNDELNLLASIPTPIAFSEDNTFNSRINSMSPAAALHAQGCA